MKFEEFNLSKEIITAIERQNITQPTQIQERAIPAIIEGKDIIGESATGSGKTIAFGCGVVEKTTPGKGLQAVVLTPTRELAEQVKEALVKLSYGKPLKFASIYGGVSINPQIDALRSVDVVVATPGRFLDHMERRTINLSKVKLVVLDEADQMFAMGFIEDVEEIIAACPKERQTLLFSATTSSQLRDLSSRHMKSPVEITAVKMVDPKKLKQVYYEVPHPLKLSLLVHLIKNEKGGLVMVFCNTRHMTDTVARTLKHNGIQATPIHGGLTQQKRTQTLSKFNSAKVEVLVCTDVAARGLHIDNVSHVYNYDIPRDSTDYVHRIGRTARAGEDGNVVNILSQMDYDNFSKIWERHPEFTISKLPKPHVEQIQMPARQEQSRGGSGSGFRRGGSRGGSSGGRGFGSRRR